MLIALTLVNGLYANVAVVTQEIRLLDVAWNPASRIHVAAMLTVPLMVPGLYASVGKGILGIHLFGVMQILALKIPVEQMQIVRIEEHRLCADVDLIMRAIRLSTVC
jgi:hypothetical protein